MTNQIAAHSSQRSYLQAANFLSSLDADWAEHVASVGPCRLQSKPVREPYEALIRAVAYQQLHAKAGDAILGRMQALYPESPFPTPEQMLAAGPDSLRGCGFSSKKATAILCVAQAAVDGVVPSLDEAHILSDAALIKRLVPLSGIGRWTVEMLMIYSLSRSDILPADDFGVRDGYRRLKALEKKPTPRQMREIAESWSPFRTVATWYLWQFPAKRPK